MGQEASKRHPIDQVAEDFVTRYRRGEYPSVIVPVFGVGEHNGIHYYAMQFIRGQGLDAVLRELRRLREAKTTCAEPVPSSSVAREAESKDSQASAIALGFLSGRMRSVKG